jgi:serine/threonine protein phosphatase PrpC
MINLGSQQWAGETKSQKVNCWLQPIFHIGQELEVDFIEAKEARRVARETKSSQSQKDHDSDSEGQPSKASSVPWRVNGFADGTTASVCVLDLKARTLMAANVGDSQAVLSRNGEAVALGVLHKPMRDEQLRIERLGARCVYGRLDGNLAVSRALGDFSWKPFVTPLPDPSTLEDELGWSELFPCSNVPFVKQLAIGPQFGDEFVLLACDGLFDVLSREEAVAWVRRRFKKTKGDTLEGGRAQDVIDLATCSSEMKAIAQELAEYAVSKGSTDNVSVCIAFFQWPEVRSSSR